MYLHLKNISFVRGREKSGHRLLLYFFRALRASNRQLDRYADAAVATVPLALRFAHSIVLLWLRSIAMILEGFGSFQIIRSLREFHFVALVSDALHFAKFRHSLAMR